MRAFRVSLELRANAEYEVEAESVEDVIDRWNEGGVAWEKFVGPMQAQRPNALELSVDAFTGHYGIDERNVEEITEEPTKHG